MKTVGDRLPDRAAAWLDAVDERLSHLDKRQREEIVDGLRLHLLEAIDSGEEADDVLVRLGSPDHVAGLSPRDDEFAAHSDYWNAKRVIQIIALALTAAAVSAIILLPSYVSETTDSAGNESITTQTVPEVGGIGFVAILAIPLIFAAAPLFAPGSSWQIFSIGSTVLLAVFAIVASPSIGFYFLPAVVLEVIAVFLRPRRHPPSGRRAQRADDRDNRVASDAG